MCVRKFLHLCCIMDLTIIQAAKNFFKITFIVELEGGSVAMFATKPKEKIHIWIPLYPLLCCKLIKSNDSVKNRDPALDDVQDICKCGTDRWKPQGLLVVHRKG